MQLLGEWLFFLVWVGGDETQNLYFFSNGILIVSRGLELQLLTNCFIMNSSWFYCYVGVCSHYVFGMCRIQRCRLHISAQEKYVEIEEL